MLTAPKTSESEAEASSSAPIPNSFEIKAVNVVNAPDFDAPRSDESTKRQDTKNEGGCRLM